MPHVILAPDGEGWTVRHERRLFERFDVRRDAMKTAVGHARRLHTEDEPCTVVEHRSFAPIRTPRARS